MPGQQYRIPDLLQHWPWASRLSDYYVEAKAESSAWVHSFHPFNVKGQKSFDACDLNLLASLTYSNRDGDFVRLGCDLMNFYFIYDEYTDVADVSNASAIAGAVIDTMHDLEAEPKDSTDILAAMIRDFCLRTRTLAPLSSSGFLRFRDTMKGYFEAVAEEAKIRASNDILPFDEYMPFRRDISAGLPTLIFTELGLSLPDYVTSHPVISALMDDAVDLIVFVNDLHSYQREISSGHAGSNIIPVIMKEHDLDLQAALDWLGTHCNQTISHFLANVEKVPSWGAEIDERVKIYIEGMGQWVRGNDDWSHQSKRYYGNEGPKIKETRFITLDMNRVARSYLKLQDRSRGSLATM